MTELKNLKIGDFFSYKEETYMVTEVHPEDNNTIALQITPQHRVWNFNNGTLVQPIDMEIEVEGIAHKPKKDNVCLPVDDWIYNFHAGDCIYHKSKYYIIADNIRYGMSLIGIVLVAPEPRIDIISPQTRVLLANYKLVSKENIKEE